MRTATHEPLTLIPGTEFWFLQDHAIFHAEYTGEDYQEVLRAKGNFYLNRAAVQRAWRMEQFLMDIGVRVS